MYLCLMNFEHTGSYAAEHVDPEGDVTIVAQDLNEVYCFY